MNIYDIDDDGNMAQRGDKGRNGILRFAPAGTFLMILALLSMGMCLMVYRITKLAQLGMKISESTNDPFALAREKIFKKVKDDAQRHLDRTVTITSPEDNLGKITKNFLEIW